MIPEMNRIYQGDCIEVMKTWPADFVDTIITDPPYGIGFMGKEWDRFDPEMIERRTEGYREKSVKQGLDKRITKTVDSPALYAGLYDQSLSGHRKFPDWCCAWATEALRVAKPGAMMLVFGGTRTFHRMTAGLEDAGWQIRDCMMWLYGSGFPKSLDISKAIDKAKGAEREVVGQAKRTGKTEGTYGAMVGDNLLTAPATDLARAWNGWGTALKPAWEPIIVAMKPLDGTFAENAEKWGVAGINVDGGRIGAGELVPGGGKSKRGIENGSVYGNGEAATNAQPHTQGRWPANLILDEDAAAMLDGQTEGQLHGAGFARVADRHGEPKGMFPLNGKGGNRLGDSGGASRFFYCAKASKSERNAGCEQLPEKRTGDFRKGGAGNERSEENYSHMQNCHPTVKPLKLMEYLCTLTKTPTGGIVFDPFAGSGTTAIAAKQVGRPWLAIEQNQEYVTIAQNRLTTELKWIQKGLEVSID